MITTKIIPSKIQALLALITVGNKIKGQFKMEKLNILLKLLLVNLPFLLVIVGIGSIVYASFLFSITTGHLVLGIALILVAYLISPQQKGGDVK